MVERPRLGVGKGRDEVGVDEGSGRHVGSPRGGGVEQCLVDVLSRRDRGDRRDDVAAEPVEGRDGLVGGHRRPLRAQQQRVDRQRGDVVDQLGDDLVRGADDGVPGDGLGELVLEVAVLHDVEALGRVGQVAALGDPRILDDRLLAGVGDEAVAAQRLRPEGLAARLEAVADDRVAARDLVLRRLGRAGVGVAVLRGAAHAGDGVGTDPDRRVRLLHGEQVRVDVVERPVLAVEGDGLLGPEPGHQLERLVEPARRAPCRARRGSRTPRGGSPGRHRRPAGPR